MRGRFAPSPTGAMRPASIAGLRAAAVAPEAVVGALAASAELVAPGARCRPADLVATFTLAHMPRHAVAIPDLARWEDAAANLAGRSAAAARGGR